MTTTTSAPNSTSTIPLVRMRGSATALSQPAASRVEFQLHGTLRLDRLVNRRDELKTLAPLQAVDQMPLVVEDALHDVLVVGMVAKPVHVRRIDGVLFHYLLVARRGMGEVPGAHLVDSKPGNLDAAVLTEDRDRALQILGPGSGCCLDYAQCAIAEAQRHHRGIFRLD